MANPKKLAAAAAIAAGLLGGGVTGLVLGAPGVSGAQTTTVPNSPSTTAPPNQAPSNGNRPPHGNCPHMGGGSGQGQSGGTSNTNVGYHLHARGGGAVY
jgi:hypothetical protein